MHKHCILLIYFTGFYLNWNINLKSKILNLKYPWWCLLDDIRTFFEQNPEDFADWPAQRFRSPDGEQNRKIFLTFFNRLPLKLFSIKETKIFLFCLSADAGIAETLSHPQPAFGGQSRRAKIPSPKPPSFLPACLGFVLKNLMSGGGTKN